ncbi:MAG: hypothetical protein JXR83_16575 [Deltaproteobacteria bacterium]|nr:hypothetical protein [Deltaproteobacteria bacterium]
MKRGRRASGWMVLGCGLALATTAGAVQLPTAVGSVSSTTAPVTIYYSRAEKAEVAAALLPAAEQAWQTQVVQLGFTAPTTIDDDLQPVTGMRFYLVQSNTYAGYARPVADLPDTPQTDCAAITVIADSYPLSYLATVLDHEFNHTLQMASDCIEGMFAMEMTAVTMQTLLHPSDTFIDYVLPDFQRQPDRAIYSLDNGSYFHFGSALFGLFLEQRYGSNDGSLLARIWGQASQPGSVTISGNGYVSGSVANEPDLFDAIGSVLGAQGVTLEQALAQFAHDRFFVGSFDDGDHLAGASRWGGAEPRFDSRFTIDQLPQWDAMPAAPPQDTGASYIAIDLAGASEEQRLRFWLAGDPEVNWHASLIGRAPEGVTEIPFPVDAEGYGEISIEQPTRFEQVVLLVANLGNGRFDLDRMSGVARSFFYSVELIDCPQVELLGADPAALEPGQRARLRIAADNLPEQAFALQVSGGGVTVVDAVRLSSTEIEATLEIADGAAAGKRDLTIELECGGSATGPGLIEILRASQGCSALAAGGDHTALLLGLLLTALGRRRRR